MPNTASTSNPPEFALAPSSAVALTENQSRVIADKYRRDGETVEAWLRRVARNIALAELLHHPARTRWPLFDGVRVFRWETPKPSQDAGPASDPFIPTSLLHHGIHSASERDDNFRRFISNCERIADSIPEARDAVSRAAESFYDLLSSWTFLPNSPTLMNAGRDLQQLSACYVLPVTDSMEGIADALKAQALIHKTGGGTGFSFGEIRPAGDPVQASSGVASGAISFLRVFDKMTDVVKQGGTRRGANMGILPYTHPEVKNFVTLKNRPGEMANFNLSIAVDRAFWDAVKDDYSFDLLNPRTGEPAGQMRARELFDAIVESAWRSGDPGLVFLDRLNDASTNPTPALGRIVATNPCGEQPLLPHEACNLGSINLSKFVKGALFEGEIDWAGLSKAVSVAVRFLDDVIDINNYPLPEIERLAKSNRRIGLGVMGWAETLVKLGLPYDSDAAADAARRVMSFVSVEALAASEALAKERGVFPNWKDSVYDSGGGHFKGDSRLPRHCARTTIAPTGTIAIAAGLQGAGIEPFFGIAYTRYNARALDRVREGRAPDPADVYFEVNPLFRAVAAAHDFFGLGEKALWARIEANRKSVRGIPEIPERIQRIFATSHDISVEAHIGMQAAFQSYTDNAVSKTVNLRHEATQDDVRRAFQLAYDQGCKGITVYRDGSKQEQVLNLASGDRRRRPAADLSTGVSSEYYEIKTGYGPLHIHIDHDESGPRRLFASIQPLGSEVSGLASSVGILISRYLEEGGDPNRILKNLQAVRGDRPVGLGENRINSIPHAIATALKTHLKKHGRLDVAAMTDDGLGAAGGESGAFELWNLANAGDQCPACFGANIRFGAGCNGPQCQDCGYSSC